MALATRPKPKPQQRKRQAQHHRQNKHYLKAYWPYLPMLLIVGLGLQINSIWSKSSVLGVQRDFSATTLLSATNDQRSGNHEAGLTIDPQLVAAAQAKANDMVQQNYWAHNSPDGRTPWSFISASGYQFQVAGENLAYGFDDASDTVTGWMNSPEHRANILSTNYQNVGFGIAQSTNFQGKGPETIVVAEYGGPVAAAANISFSVPTTPDNTTAQSVPGTTEVAAKPVSRVQVLTGGQAAWSLVAVSALAGSALTIFVIRHGYRLHRAMNRGEAFIIHHPWLDIGIVLICTVGFVLTRSSGIIR